MERLLTIPEVAERTRLGRTTIYELMARGDLPSVVVEGTRSRRVREAALDEWIRRQAEPDQLVAASA